MSYVGLTDLVGCGGQWYVYLRPEFWPLDQDLVDNMLALLRQWLVNFRSTKELGQLGWVTIFFLTANTEEMWKIHQLGIMNRFDFVWYDQG